MEEETRDLHRVSVLVRYEDGILLAGWLVGVYDAGSSAMPIGPYLSLMLDTFFPLSLFSSVVSTFFDSSDIVLIKFFVVLKWHCVGCIFAL